MAISYPQPSLIDVPADRHLFMLLPLLKSFSISQVYFLLKLPYTFSLFPSIPYQKMKKNRFLQKMRYSMNQKVTVS